MEKEQRGCSAIFIIYGTANGKGETGAFYRIWYRIRMFLDLPDLDPDPLVGSMDPHPALALPFSHKRC
jgi:hypothetical protein